MRQERVAEQMSLKSVMGPLFLSLLLFLEAGCATSPARPPLRAFAPSRDGFAFTNQLVWNYRMDSNGVWKTEKRVPAPDYALHCFVLARSARQFFENARFDSSLPKVSEAEYRQQIKTVVHCSPRRVPAEEAKIVIPGYDNLFEFSRAEEKALKAECGGAWQSYLQRGNWRLVFPFTHRGQERTARKLMAALGGRPVVIHLCKFPQQTINHAVLAWQFEQRGNEIEFLCYDPNMGAQPTVVHYNTITRDFSLPANHYFPGGKLNVYEVYRNVWF